MTIAECVHDHNRQHHEYVLAAGASDVVLKFLALPYAEHPDYRQEWRL